MWIPMLSKKGGRTHRRVCLIYGWAMAAVTVTALLICALKPFTRTANVDGALFLGLVGILSGASTAWGYRILKQKGRKGRHEGVVDWIVALVLGSAGLLGLSRAALGGGGVLFAIFGVGCLALSLANLRCLHRPPRVVVWVAPGMIGRIGIGVWVGRYRARFEKSARS
jgi:hypothetical protein